MRLVRMGRGGRRAGDVNPAHHFRNRTLLFRNQGLEPASSPHDGGDGAVIVVTGAHGGTVQVLCLFLFRWAIFESRITPYQRGRRGAAVG